MKFSIIKIFKVKQAEGRKKLYSWANFTFSIEKPSQTCHIQHKKPLEKNLKCITNMWKAHALSAPSYHIIKIIIIIKNDASKLLINIISSDLILYQNMNFNIIIILY